MQIGPLGLIVIMLLAAIENICLEVDGSIESKSTGHLNNNQSWCS